MADTTDPKKKNWWDTLGSGLGGSLTSSLTGGLTGIALGGLGSLLGGGGSDPGKQYLGDEDRALQQLGTVGNNYDAYGAANAKNFYDYQNKANGATTTLANYLSQPPGSNAEDAARINNATAAANTNYYNTMGDLATKFGGGGGGQASSSMANGLAAYAAMMRTGGINNIVNSNALNNIDQQQQNRIALQKLYAGERDTAGQGMMAGYAGSAGARTNQALGYGNLAQYARAGGGGSMFG